MTETRIDVTLKESALIEKLRQIPYGKVEIFMVDGKPDRIVKTEVSEKV